MTFKIELPKIEEMYDYLRAPAGELPDEVDVAFVFGRKSSHLITAATKAARRTRFLVVSGNVGKDSGDLPARGIPEATFIADGVRRRALIHPRFVRTDLNAKNGLENARNGIDIIMNELGLPRVDTLATVMHGPQVRRLGATFEHQAQRAGLEIGRLVHLATDYPFDPTNLYDQYEVAGEIVRLHALSAITLREERALDRPNDLQGDLLAYAQAVQTHLDIEFASQGILNPSTADDTNHFAPIPSL